jgi:hypothetical protein
MGRVAMPNYQIPREVINYVWKTGFISKKIWQTYFFKGNSERTMLRKWKYLVDRSYLKPHSNEHLKNLLVLNKANKFIMQLYDTHPAYAPNPVQIEHDEILLEGILRLSHAQLLDQWQTEAELKMLGHNEFRIEAQGQKIKYPDAILYFSNANRLQVVAVEYEKTLKSRKRYRQILNSYASLKNVNAVIWIVNSLPIQNAIIEQAKQEYYPFKERPIAFVNVNSWKNDPEKLLKIANEIIE